MTTEFGRILPASDEDRAGMSVAHRTVSAAPAVFAALLPIMAAVSVAFLVIGMALPVLPLHVDQDLRLGAFVVGLVTGSQFVASLLSRVWAGRFADSRGARRAVLERDRWRRNRRKRESHSQNNE